MKKKTYRNIFSHISRNVIHIFMRYRIIYNLKRPCDNIVIFHIGIIATATTTVVYNYRIGMFNW